MNYITDGTFWVVVLALAGVIGAMWYNLKKEIDKLKEIAKVQESQIASHKMVLDFLSDALDILGEKVDKKTYQQIEQLVKEYENRAYKATHK